ncbi:MAG: hypothetical protein PHY43_00545 [Verrucomicrobiales bacterium]|nr:hypothetical protein [Verrucomicrobiales bacterium]
MIHSCWATFTELIVTPFAHVALFWGIVPLYFGLLLNELTADKASFRTALQTGFSFLWAGAQWLWPYFVPHASHGHYLELNAMLPVSLLVTFSVLGFGVVALVSGIRKKFPKHLRFIGHTRFANYFMIAIFPIQSHYLEWTWERLIAIILFAVPIWVTLHFGLMPLRNSR